MTIIHEGDLEFSFGESWNVLKYDDDGGYYKTVLMRRFEKTKAVDFLGSRSTEPLLMLEVKDYSRDAPDEDRFNELPTDVAKKVRDTLVGIVGGSYTAVGSERRAFIESYRKLSSPPRVVFFFEDLATPARRLQERARGKKSVLLNKLKEHLRWLTRDVAVVGLYDYRASISDLTIRRI